MDKMKKEKIVDTVINVLEGIFGTLFLLGGTLANDYNPLWVPLVWVLVFGSIFYGVYRVDEWRTQQKEERKQRRLARKRRMAQVR